METKTGRIEAIKRTKIMHEFIDEFYEEIAYGEEEND
jgi:hypothetical protein